MTIFFIGAYHQLNEIKILLKTREGLSIDILFYSHYLEERIIRELLDTRGCGLVPLESVRWYELSKIYAQKRFVRSVLCGVEHNLFTSQYLCNSSLILFGLTGKGVYNLLDEGTSSFVVVLKRRRLFHRLSVIFKSLMFGFNKSLFPRSVCFITKFNLNVGESDTMYKLVVEKDELNIPVSEYVIFLGSSFVYNNELSEIDYKRTVLQTLGNFQNVRINYVPHRFENVKWLLDLNFENLTVQSIEFPFEEYIKNLKSLPMIIMAVAPSTALYNIGLMYASSIQLIALAPLGRWKRNVKVYTELSNRLHERVI